MRNKSWDFVFLDKNRLTWDENVVFCKLAPREIKFLQYAFPYSTVGKKAACQIIFTGNKVQSIYFTLPIKGLFNRNVCCDCCNFKDKIYCVCSLVKIIVIVQ